MVERKKRGLGRGLGALIPDANSNDRPVDVFFSGSDAADGTRDNEPRASRTARNDPAASMQSSRRRKPKAESTGKTAGSSASGKTTASKPAAKAPSKSADATKSTDTAKSSAKKAASTKSAQTKTGASASSSAKTTASKSTTKKSSTSTTSGAKKTTPANKTASAANKTTSTAKKSSHGKTSSAAKASSTGSSASATKASPEARVDESTNARVEPAQSINAVESASAAPDAGVASEDVKETHPGVYTSSGYDNDSKQPDEKNTETMETTNVVSGESDSASVQEVDEDGPDSFEDSADSVEVSLAGSSEESHVEDQSESESYDGVESIPDTEFGEIDVDLVDANPRQPRTVFDEDLLAELVHSIREIGVLQPVVVRQKPSDHSRFELIMGERRLRATKDAGLSTIPAIIRYVEDTDLLRDALLENLHRAELNPLEEAAAYGQLLEDFGCTQEELSERIGRSRPQISNTLRLLRLPPLVQRRVAAGVISAGHARAILGLRDPEHMEVLAQRIVAEGLSVRASEEAVVLLNRGDSINVSRATTKVAPEFLAVAERLGDRLDTKVHISVGKRKGKLSVEFANQEDLDRILGLLGIASPEGD